MRRLSLLFAVLFVLPLFGSDSLKEYDGKMVAEGIEGTWRLVEMDGQKVGLPDQDVVTYCGGKYTEKLSVGTSVGKYRIDTSCKPARLDLFTSSGDLSRWIYQVDGDNLKVAGIPLLFREYPPAFSEDDLWILTYKRVK